MALETFAVSSGSSAAALAARIARHSFEHAREAFFNRLLGGIALDFFDCAVWEQFNPIVRVLA